MGRRYNRGMGSEPKRCSDPRPGLVDPVGDRPPPAERLSLYYSPTCGFCVRVLRVIRELDLDVELRNVRRDPAHRQALLEARGRATVPVLRLTSAVTDRWMPESADIVRYLRANYGSRAKSSSR